MSAQGLTILLPLFFLTALIYSTVGFAGGSTYLALLALFGVAYQLMPVTALVCNMVVAFSGTWIYWRAGHLKLKNTLPFLVTSLPMAYWGGRVPISKEHFLFLLGVVLFVAALRLFLSDASFGGSKETSWRMAWLWGVPLGGALGFVSGLTGIGGGILLAPVLYFLGWANAKQVAAAASFFILLNSAAGFLGQIQKNGTHIDWFFMAPLAGVVFLGGQIGSRLGAQRFSRVVIQRLTGALILVIAVKLILGGLCLT